MTFCKHKTSVIPGKKTQESKSFMPILLIMTQPDCEEQKQHGSLSFFDQTYCEKVFLGHHTKMGNAETLQRLPIEKGRSTGRPPFRPTRPHLQAIEVRR